MSNQKHILIVVAFVLSFINACASVTTSEIKEFEQRGNINKLIDVVYGGDKQARLKAIRALGDLKDPRGIKALTDSLHSPSWVEREAAVIAIGKINDILSIKPLVIALGDSNQFVRERAAKLLQSVAINLAKVQKNSRVTDILFTALNTKDGYTREHVSASLQATIDIFKSNTPPYLVGQLLNQLKSLDRYARREAAKALGKFNEPRVVKPLLNAQRDPDPEVQINATEALLKVNNPQSVHALLMALANDNSDVREDAIAALKKFTRPEEVAQILASLHDTNPNVRESVIKVLLENKTDNVIQAFVPLLIDPVASVRKAAADALQNLGWQAQTDHDKALNCVAAQDWNGCSNYSDAAFGPLLFAMHDVSPDIRQKAAATLIKMNWTPTTDEEKGINCVMRQQWEECISLGEASIQALVREINTPDINVKQNIFTTLAKINSIKAIQPLVIALNTDDASIRVSIVNALGKFNHPLAIKTLLHALDDNNYYVRQAALTALKNNIQQFNGNTIFDVRTPIQNALKDNNRNVRLAAAELLGELQDPATVDSLINVMTDQDEDVRSAAAAALLNIKNPDVIPDLINALKNPDPDTRINVLHALAGFKDKRALDALIRELNDGDSEVTLEAIKLVGKIDSPSTIAPLLKLLASDNEDIERQTILALANKNDPQIINPLVKFLSNVKSNIRETAGNTLVKLNWKPATKEEEGSHCIIKRDWPACEALGKSAVNALVRELRDTDSPVRIESARTLGIIRDNRAIVPLVGAIGMTQWTRNNSDLLETIKKALIRYNMAAVPELAKHLTEWYTGYYAAQVLKSIGWVPQSDHQLVHYQVALRDKKKLLANWSVTNRILNADTFSTDPQAQRTAIFALIGLGKSESMDRLLNALLNSNSAKIAEAYLNSGNKKLKTAALTWTTDHNLEINNYSKGNSPVLWGDLSGSKAGANQASNN